MTAELHEHNKSCSVCVWRTASNNATKIKIDRGHDPRISRDSRWLSVMQRSAPDLDISKPNRERLGQRLVLLDLKEGGRKTFDNVLSYDMTYSSTYLLYLQASETTVPGERAVGTLYQMPLNHDRLKRIGHRQPDWSGRTENVTGIVVHPKNDHFAYVVCDSENGSETLRVCNGEYEHGTTQKKS